MESFADDTSNISLAQQKKHWTRFRNFCCLVYEDPPPFPSLRHIFTAQGVFMSEKKKRERERGAEKGEREKEVEVYNGMYFSLG